MSELKDRWFWAYPTESVDCDGITGSAHEVYSKYEVDKVIADKDKEIAELKAQYNSAILWKYDAQNEHNTAVASCMENIKLKAKLAKQDKELRNLQHALWIAKASRFRSGYFHFDLEMDFWADRNDQEKENHYYKKREQCSRLELKCRERAKRFE